MSEIDKKFDKAEKVVERTQKLLVKIVGAIAAVAVAAWALMAEFGNNEQYDDAYDEGYEQYEPDAQYDYEGDEYFNDSDTSLMLDAETPE